jgi:hypothetical protein
MKTTLEIPDPLFRKAKATAAERGQSLKEFVAEALQDKLAGGRRPSPVPEPAWMEGFGQLKHLHEETVRIQSIIDDEFEVIEPEDRR